MTLIRDRQIIADDYVALADDIPLPLSGKVIVSLARWQKEAELPGLAALQRGVRLPNTADVHAIWSSIADCALIVLEFPAFADGRAYSQARLLRDACGYTREIRACGAAVVRDQLQGMMRCGINAFELRTDQDVNSCLQAFAELRLAYQSAADARIQIIADMRRNAQTRQNTC